MGCCSVGVLSFADSLLIERLGLARLDANSPPGTVAKTGPETIAEVISHQPGFAIDNLNGPFGASRNTQAAAVTFLFIDFDHIANHHYLPDRVEVLFIVE